MQLELQCYATYLPLITMTRLSVPSGRRLCLCPGVALKSTRLPCPPVSVGTDRERLAQADLVGALPPVARGAGVLEILKRAYNAEGSKKRHGRTTRVVAGLLVTLAAIRLAQGYQHGKSEKLGVVHFAISCNAGAQKEIDRAVALLHSFQFSRAIEGFNVVLGEDATCGVGYWGIALSDWGNPFAAGVRDKSQLQAGWENAERGKAAGAKSEREREYLAAVGKLYGDHAAARA
jgi:hypothetical protein